MSLKFLHQLAKSPGLILLLFSLLVVLNTLLLYCVYCYVKSGFGILGTALSSRQVFFAIFALTALCLCIYWYFFYPAGMTPDTKNQLAQIHGELSYSNVHSLAHTILMGLLLKLWNNPAVFILFHILLISLLYALFAAYFTALGVPFIPLAVLTFFSCLPLSPAKAYMYPWKDTPYTFCLGILTYFIMRSFEQDYRFTKKRCLLLGLAAAFSVLLRYNGIVPVLFTLAYFIVYFIRQKNKSLIIAVIAAICSFLVVDFYAYQILDARKLDNGFALQVFGSGIAAVTAKGGEISEAEYEQLEELLPIEWMQTYYSPYTNAYLLWTVDEEDEQGLFQDPDLQVFNNYFVIGLGEHKAEVIRMYFRLLPKNLRLMISDIIGNTYMIWGIYDLKFFYTNAFLSLFLLSCMLLLWRFVTFSKYWCILIPVFGNTLSIAISTVTNEERYLLPTFTLFMPLLLFILVKNRFQET